MAERLNGRAVVLGMRPFAIVIQGATDGTRLILGPAQLSGVSGLEAAGILAQVRIGAPQKVLAPTDRGEPDAKTSPDP